MSLSLCVAPDLVVARLAHLLRVYIDSWQGRTREHTLGALPSIICLLPCSPTDFLVTWKKGRLVDRTQGDEQKAPAEVFSQCQAAWGDWPGWALHVFFHTTDDSGSVHHILICSNGHNFGRFTYLDHST